MPAADYRLGGKQSKKRPPRKVAPVLAQSLAQERQYASQGKAVQKAASPPRPQRLKAGIPKLENAPGRKAAKQAERKQARAEPKINLPYFPKLKHPTDEQRGAVIEGTARSARAQASPEQIRRKRLYGSKTERQRLNRGAGARKTAVRDINVKAALRALGHPDAKPAPGRTGELAAMGAEIADAQHPRATPGKPHRKISAAGVNIDVTALGRGLAAAAAQHVTSGHGAPLKNLPVLAKNTGKDALALPVGAVKGIYEVGAAGVEAAQGDTKRAKRIIGSLDEGALGRLLIHADVPGAEKAFREHPLFSALDVAGAYSVAGRGAGAVARSGTLGKGAKAAAATKRADLLTIPGTNQRVARSYSKNLITQGLQKRGERAAVKRGEDPTVLKPSMVRDALHTLSGGTTRGGRRGQLHQAVDEFASQAEGVRRVGRDELRRGLLAEVPVRGQGKAARAIDRRRGQPREVLAGREISKRPERHVVALAVEGVIKSAATMKRDLLGEHRRLQTVYDAEKGRMGAAARRENKGQRARIEAVLRDPKALANGPEVMRAAQAYMQRGAKVEGELVRQRVLDPEQALAARVRPVAVRELGATPAPRPGRTPMGLVDAEGNRVSTADVVSHLGDRPTPGFVTHRRDTGGSRAHFVNWFDRRKSTGAKRRTGEATRTGAHSIDERTLHESLIHSQGIADAVGNFDRFVGQFGTKAPDGKHFTWDEAERHAAEIADQGGPELVPLRAMPARLSDDALADITRAQDAGTLPRMESIVDEQIGQARTAPRAGEGARNVVLVSEEQLQRFRDHQTLGTGPAGRAFQKATGIFRGTVLPFSTKWVTGNVVEAALRSAVAGVAPGRDALIGRRLVGELRKLDAEKASQFHTRAAGGLLFGSSERLGVYRDRSTLSSTGLEGVGQTLGTIARLPVVRQALAGVDSYQRAVFGLNKAAERYFQLGVIGKQGRREIQELSGSWVKATRAQKAALQDVAKGLLGTPSQVRFAREVDAVLGKYTRFSPTMRRATQVFAPFAPWYINSLRFATHTLPVGHPMLTALLTNVERTFQQDWDTAAEDLPPGDLESAIQLKDGGLLPLARYTPFGAFTDLPAGALDPVLPQFSSIAKIIDGRSFTGRDLQVKDGEPTRTGRPGHDPSPGQQAAMAFYSALEAFLPGLALGRRLQEHGETAWDDSTLWAPKTKPGTSHGASAAERVFNPLRPTYLSKGPAKKPTAAQMRKLLGTTTSKDPVTAARQEAARGVQDIANDPEILRIRREIAGIR